MVKKQRPLALVTGSAGLVGSAVATHLCDNGWEVVGVDSFVRGRFFGEEADTGAVAEEMYDNLPYYSHINADLRDVRLYKELRPCDLVVHAASQPSHDWAAAHPLVDFEVNAHTTLLLLEWLRHISPGAVFIYMSTNKVYGDTINRQEFDELATRVEPHDSRLFMNGVDESMRIDHTLHSLFGVSKTTGDLLTQEYGRYFNLRTLCFRCGCLTGAKHRGVKQHGFLSYLSKCVRNETSYTIIGYDGKQVRDNLHADDVATACLYAWHNMQERPVYGEAYNLGGGRTRDISVLEALEYFQHQLRTSIPVLYEDLPRKGDHIWWVTDYSKFLEWTMWSPSVGMEEILEDLCRG